MRGLVWTRTISAALAVALLSASVGTTTFAFAEAKPADKKEAGKHFKKGKELFEKKDYKAAKQEFLQADTILPAATAEYYVARCAEENGDDADAINWFQKAIDAGTLKDDQATDAKTRLAALKKKTEPIKPPETKPVDATPTATTTTTAPVTTDTASGKKDMTWVYVTGGAAVVSLGVGAFFGIAALKSKKDFDDSPTRDTRDTGNRNALIADIGLGLGVTFGIAAALIYFSNPTAAPTATASKSSPIFAPVIALPTGKNAPSMTGVAALFHF